MPGWVASMSEAAGTGATRPRLVIARNPDPDSKLPYLLRLPIDGGLVLVGTARPGARIPGRRASGIEELEIVEDTRERYPYRFAHQKAHTVREALPAGDYAVRDSSGLVVAAVERKALADLASGLSNGTLVFELARLAELPRAAVVVEDRYSALVAHAHAHAPAGFLPDMLARVAVRYPEVPILFLETRPFAEEWTFRYLAAALAEALAEATGVTAPGGSTEEPPRSTE